MSHTDLRELEMIRCVFFEGLSSKEGSGQKKTAKISRLLYFQVSPNLFFSFDLPGIIKLSILGGIKQHTSKSMVIVRDSPYSNALFGFIYNHGNQKGTPAMPPSQERRPSKGLLTIGSHDIMIPQHAVRHVRFRRIGGGGPLRG